MSSPSLGKEGTASFFGASVIRACKSAQSEAVLENLFWKTTNFSNVCDPIDRNVVPPILRALHACSVKAAKYLFFVWQLEQFAVYETCMAKHGQRFD
jgi:hypothetical protein